MTDQSTIVDKIARQAVAQTFSDYDPQRVFDILLGRYDFNTDMIVAKATVALTLELIGWNPKQ